MKPLGIEHETVKQTGATIYDLAMFMFVNEIIDEAELKDFLEDRKAKLRS